MEVLIVDCDADILILFRQKFRREIRAGLLNFKFFSSGESLLDYLFCYEECPALVLILSDISLPGMSGTQLLEILKVKYPQIKVFTIAAIEKNRSRQLVNYRADYYFNKPIELELIKTKILQLKKILG